MTEKRTTQVRIKPSTARALRELAASFGIYQSRGVLAGESVGNVAGLMEAIARGELKIVRCVPREAPRKVKPT